MQTAAVEAGDNSNSAFGKSLPQFLRLRLCSFSLSRLSPPSTPLLSPFPPSLSSWFPLPTPFCYLIEREDDECDNDEADKEEELDAWRGCHTSNLDLNLVSVLVVIQMILVMRDRRSLRMMMLADNECALDMMLEYDDDTMMQ